MLLVGCEFCLLSVRMVVVWPCVLLSVACVHCCFLTVSIVVGCSVYRCLLACVLLLVFSV